MVGATLLFSHCALLAILKLLTRIKEWKSQKVKDFQGKRFESFDIHFALGSTRN